MSETPDGDQANDNRSKDQRPGARPPKDKVSNRGDDKQRGSEKKPPPAGPHADPSLINEEATPGAGTLPPPDGEPNGGGSVSS